MALMRALARIDDQLEVARSKERAANEIHAVMRASLTRDIDTDPNRRALAKGLILVRTRDRQPDHRRGGRNSG